MAQWTKLKNDNKISYNEIFYFEEEINNIPLNTNSPYQCFSLFFDEPFLGKILKNSNNYLNHKKEKINNGNNTKFNKISNTNNNKLRVDKITKLSYENIEKYIACLILMGIVGLPSYHDYWDKDELLLNAVKYIMKKNTFENINQFIHPEPADSKNENKILSSIKYIMQKAKLYFSPGTIVTIDERMVSYRGRSNDIVYEASKPVKWGFRPYVLADLNTGYIFEIKLLEQLEEKKKMVK